MDSTTITQDSTNSVATVDPIMLEVVRNYLITTCREMGVAMMRTSYSTMFNEARDFSCVVFDDQGEMVAMADFCPAHIGAVVHTVEWAIKEVGPENFVPGDVILHNDPFRGGCHLPEYMTLKPCFFNGRIVAYAANIAHMSEIGGMVPGAFGDTRNVFQEGLRIPPVKIFREDQEVEDIFSIITSNVRTPRVSYGDIMAMVGSTYLAEQRILELIGRYGLDTVMHCYEDIKNVSEVLMRKAISKFPDGEYSAEGYIEDDGVIADRPWRIKATLVMRGDELIVDYTGSDEQSPGQINQTFGATASASYSAVFHMVDEPIPFNHGAYRPISIVAPPGTVMNVSYPGSSVGGNSDTFPTTVDILLKAFGQFSDRSQAADGGTACLCGFCGRSVDTDAETGETFVYLHHDGIGWGGRADHDGNDAQIVKNGNCLNSPIEVIETRYPLRVEVYRIAEGSAGPGKHRGGFGIERIWRALAPITLSVHTNRLKIPAWGVHGGGESGNTKVLIQPAGTDDWLTVKELYGTISPAKFSNVPLNPGDRFLFRSPGGGGYGNPLDRDPNLVLEDYLDEMIEVEGAARVYGVVMLPEVATVDLAATKRLREEMKHATAT